MFVRRVWSALAVCGLLATGTRLAWSAVVEERTAPQERTQQQAAPASKGARQTPVQQAAAPAASTPPATQRKPAQKPAPVQSPTKARPPAVKPQAAEQVGATPPPDLELWSIPFRVGAAQGDATSRGVGGQIAVRGPLIVVAAGGDKPNAPDDQDGVFIIDGRDGSIVRRLEVPGGDAAGVALTGDDVVFTAGTLVVRSRLDGLVRWTTESGGRPGLPALADLNADGVLEAILPVDSGVGTEAISEFLALDGASGRALWRVKRDAKAHADPLLLIEAMLGEPEGADNGTNTWFAPYVRVGRGFDGSPLILAGEGFWQLLIEANGRTTHSTNRSALSQEERGILAWRAPLERNEFTSFTLEATELGYQSMEATVRGTLQLAGGSRVAFLAGRSSASLPFCAFALELGPGASQQLSVDPCGLPPSLGNLDGNDTWDVVFADGERLRAFSTGLSADLSQPFPRGDLAATGMLPEHLESLASYRSKLAPRDTAWWLAPDVPERARDAAFRPVTKGAPSEPSATREALPAELLAVSSKGHVIRDAERSAALLDSSALVCWSPSECVSQAVPWDVKLSQLALEPGARRLWALSTRGAVFSLDAGATSWVERVWSVPEGSLRAAERLRVLPDALAVLEPGRFWLLPRAAALPHDDPHGAALHLDDLVQCGERWFGNNEGRLVAPVADDLSRWAVVPGQPGPVRSLACNGSELELTAGNGSHFALALPRVPVRWSVWGALVALFGGLLALAVWMVRSRPPRVDPKAVVSRGWRKDVPLRRMSQAAGSQQRLVQGLLDFIDNAGTRPPLSIAVCGPWGSGKSSLMGVLHDELRETGRHVLVWFNAWRFQREEDITRAFYQSILDEFRRQASWPIRLKVVVSRIQRAGVWRVLWFVVSTLLALTALGMLALIARGALLSDRAPLTATLSLVVTVLLTLLGAWNRGLGPLLKVVNVDTGKVLDQLKGRLRFAHNMKAEFETVFAGLGDALKLVVFVDDLDRCTPDRVTDMLEALNGIADTGHCVLVLGIDPASVERAVHVRFREIIGVMERQGNLEEARSFGARYVEKMITASVLVPELDPTEVLERDRGAAISEAVVKPLYRRSPRALGRALMDRAPVGVTLAALATFIWSCSAVVDLDLSRSALDRRARVLYDWCRDLATPTPESKAAAASATAAATTPVTNAASVSSLAVAAVALPVPDTLPPPDAAQGASDSPPLQLPPVLAAPAPPSAFAPFEGHEAPHLELESLERRRFLLDSFALCAFLLLSAGALGLFVQRQRAREARPMSEDSEPFRGALQRASRSLPALPRTVIRFENVARFVYHIVQQSPRWQPGSEEAFFEALLPLWLGQALPPATPDWLERELGGWLRGTARGSSAAGSGPLPKSAAE